MTRNTLVPTPGPLRAVIIDYNGVIGYQPEPDDWTRLAALAGWGDQTAAFEAAFWQAREPYDAGETTAQMFWHGLLRGGKTAPAGSAALDALRRTDVAMWVRTDPVVLDVLHAVHRTGVPMILLSNAPHDLGSALDDTPWCSQLMWKTIYSARIGTNKPARRAYQATLAAAGWPPPEQTLFIDNLRENCDAAEQLGITTFHYQDDALALADHLRRRIPRLAVDDQRRRIGRPLVANTAYMA
ncbi:HAD-IA family hydrolase [Streptomyces sp. NBC_01601]|uniref:HAD-IA family hydrolase n=1 Tax=Streptomyces sp. NBC_01601 TaxID=2975892 RepID=UPI002E2E7ABD|nr:HAD-IA family hydrolase [Streptomyces sp. NBC_01601]